MFENGNGGVRLRRLHLGALCVLVVACQDIRRGQRFWSGLIWCVPNNEKRKGDRGRNGGGSWRSRHRWSKSFPKLGNRIRHYPQLLAPRVPFFPFSRSFLLFSFPLFLPCFLGLK